MSGHLGRRYLDPEKRSQTPLLWAVRDGGTTQGATRSVLMHLILRASKKKNWTCFPSLSRIAQDTQLNRAPVTRALRELTGAGLIKRTRRCRTTSLYWVLFDRIELLAEAALVEKKAPKTELGIYDSPTPPTDTEEGWT